jgi:hypothetical protein
MWPSSVLPPRDVAAFFTSPCVMLTYVDQSQKERSSSNSFRNYLARVLARTIGVHTCCINSQDTVFYCYVDL